MSARVKSQQKILARKTFGWDLENLLKHPPAKLEDMVDVDVNLIRPILAARGVQVSTFNLV